ALGSAGVARAAAGPGAPRGGGPRAPPLLAVVGWWLWLAAEVRWLAVGSELWPVTEGWGCVAKAMFVGFVPAAVLTAMIARAAPQDLRRTCLFAGLAAAAVGALGVEVTCPMNSPTHLLVWHGGPVMMTVVLVTLIAALATRGFGALRIR
ncbi:MAG: NrsF family protein, partial [Acidimicrobiia bacterium]